MRYLMIDRIVEWKAGEKIRGIKNIAMSEDFLEYHFPRNPVMPGVLLLEALSQLTGWLEAASSDFGSWFLITKVRSCKFYGFSLPGDQIELTVERSREAGQGELVFVGTAMADGKRKVLAEYEGEHVPFDEIEDVQEQRKFFTILTRER